MKDERKHLKGGKNERGTNVGDEGRKGAALAAEARTITRERDERRFRDERPALKGCLPLPAVATIEGSRLSQRTDSCISEYVAQPAR